ncbi:Wall-associated receptor kinase 3 [Hordeum vulgare]|nr:Wall-associated receptor kinase 3 [Hordeum vulgare]
MKGSAMPPLSSLNEYTMPSYPAMKAVRPSWLFVSQGRRECHHHHLRSLAAVDATTTPNSVALLRESILAHQTPNHQGATPSRSIAFNVQDEALLHRRKHPLVP